MQYAHFGLSFFDDHLLEEEEESKESCDYVSSSCSYYFESLCFYFFPFPCEDF